MSTEGLFRRFLRAAGTSAGQRVFFAVPEQDAPATPFLVFGRTGGAPDEYRRDVMLFRMEVWADTKFDADQLATALGLLINGMQAPDFIPYTGPEGILEGGGVSSVIPAPGANTRKRYALTGWVQARLS